jgi:hypothetical protein
MTPAEYAARYVLCWQQARHGSRLAQRRSRRLPKPDGRAWLAQLDQSAPRECEALLVDVLCNYDLREVSRRVNLALLGWLRGQWTLTLCENVPSPREVLRMQARGTRPATAVAEYPRLLEPVLGKPDAFAFLCHDLEHAWQFFRDPAQHDSQKRFARRLDRAVEQGMFRQYLDDADFAGKFHYLAADMNTHVAHSLQYLRAILLDWHLRAEGKGSRDRLSPGSRARLDRWLADFSAGRADAAAAALPLP